MSSSGLHCIAMCCSALQYTPIEAVTSLSSTDAEVENGEAADAISQKSDRKSLDIEQL